ncbi:MAG: GTPase Era [Polyangiaceae bacterium]|nr:GTPase Era [Polyangiaceae bacterium]
MRAGTLALVGHTNAGKSTLLNALVGEPLAVVSRRPETTRDVLLGVTSTDDSELSLLDTPGLHRPRSELGRRMNATALGSVEGADVVVLLVDAAERLARRGSAPDLDADELELLQRARRTARVVVAVNKVDRLRDKTRLLPLLAAIARHERVEAVVPLSARVPADAARLRAVLVPLLPEGPAVHDRDTLTDRPLRWFVAEYVREQVLLQTAGEVPHATAVGVDLVEERGKVLRAVATIHVERPGQRTILVGAGGQRIKAVGTAARERLEALAGRKVHLELFVRVSAGWKDGRRALDDLGYAAPAGAPPAPGSGAPGRARPKPRPGSRAAGRRRTLA